jgi:hypothetical protein
MEGPTEHALFTDSKIVNETWTRAPGNLRWNLILDDSCDLFFYLSTVQKNTHWREWRATFRCNNRRGNPADVSLLVRLSCKARLSTVCMIFSRSNKLESAIRARLCLINQIITYIIFRAPNQMSQEVTLRTSIGGARFEPPQGHQLVLHRFLHPLKANAVMYLKSRTETAAFHIFTFYYALSSCCGILCSLSYWIRK